MEQFSHKRRFRYFSFSIFFILITAVTQLRAQSRDIDSMTHVSIETDPAFWWGTISNGLGVDANLDVKLRKMPRVRLGLLVYSGKWEGTFAKSLLLTDDFATGDWQTTWSGAGVEAQYQFRLGLTRGGLQPGLRLQWNQFVYNAGGNLHATANQFAVTPQVGFQWFPFKSYGFYVLPWAGIQLPVSGTSRLSFPDAERQTRKNLIVVTAHLGWEFSWR